MNRPLVERGIREREKPSLSLLFFSPNSYFFPPNREPVHRLEGFLRYRFGGLIFGGAYIWRGLYMAGLIFGILRYLDSQLKGPNSS